MLKWHAGYRRDCGQQVSMNEIGIRETNVCAIASIIPDPVNIPKKLPLRRSFLILKKY